MVRQIALLHAVALVLSVGSASANDTTAALTTGGLVFGKTADIEMRAEDLSISKQQIVVRYRFFNRSSADQTVTVAFPMPEVEWKDSTAISIPDEQADNFLDFRTSVDGAPVQAQIEQKAFVDGRDVTQRLVALGVPLMPSAKKTQAALEALPPDVQKKLIAEKIIRPDDFDAGKGMEHHLSPEWSVKTTYYWRQTFPAGRELNVEHRYRPSVGGSVQTSVNAPNTPEEAREYELFCPDAAFKSGVAALTRRNKNAPPGEQRIAYVLTTGANWAGPIGDYRLTVDKGSTKALISFCETGVRKVGPTTFEVRHSNFTPTRDLRILIVNGLE